MRVCVRVFVSLEDPSLYRFWFDFGFTRIVCSSALILILHHGCMWTSMQCGDADDDAGLLPRIARDGYIQWTKLKEALSVQFVLFFLFR